MTRLLLILAVLPCFALSGANFSYAQEDAAEEQPAPELEQEQEDAAAADQPAEEAEAEVTEESSDEAKKAARIESTKLETMDPDLRALNEGLAAVTGDLDSNNRRHFYTLYNNNNLIRTVEYVRDHVGSAIDACSENNPDMEEALRGRYKEWTDAVDTKLSDAEAQVQNMVLAQDYASEDEINKVLKQANELRAKTQENVERIPVTSAEACEYLLNKMDETQANMESYLDSVLVAMPQAMDE